MSLLADLRAKSQSVPVNLRMKKLALTLALLALALPAFAQRFTRYTTNVFDLVVLNPNNNDRLYMVLGLTNFNDGLGGPFLWSPGNVTATNTTSVFATLYPGTVGRFLRADLPTLAFSTGVGITNIANVVSGNYYPGTGTTFTTNTYGQVTIDSSGGGGTNNLQVFSGLYGGALPTDTPTTPAALAYDMDPPGVLYFWDGLLWY